MTNKSRQNSKASFVRIVVAALFVLAALSGRAMAQQNNAPASSAVPPIIQFTGTLGGGSASVPAGTVSITFTLYEAEQGGTALWSETQNVQVDAQGHYTALLGSTSPEGLPLSLFTGGQAHWLAVQPLLHGAAEEARVMLVGVPYAMKAADADTLGGLPASAFIQAAPSAAAGSGLGDTGTAVNVLAGAGSAGSTAKAPSKNSHPPAICTPVPGDITYWDSQGSLCPSSIFQVVGGTNIGIGNTAPSTALEVGGAITADTFYDITKSENPVLSIGWPSPVIANDNICVGVLACGQGMNSTSGTDNTIMGYKAGLTNTASGSTFYGYWAGLPNTGTGNSFFGYEAGMSNTSGYDNTFLGNL